MGIDDRDDYRSRGQAARRRGSYESSEPPAGRSQYRGGRDDDPRGRPRGYGRDDDPRASSGSRHQRGADGSGGYDRRPRPDQSGGARRPRSDWDSDPSARRRPPDDYTRGERSARGQRPPMREYTDASMRSRGGPRGAGDSGARGRAGAAVAQTRGGVWGDEPLRPAGLRPGMAGARNGRGARRDEAADEEESTSAAAAFGKALLAIILALLIGAGAAYGYYMYSTPKAPASVTPPSTTPASGASGSTGSVSSGSAHMAPFSAQRDARTLFVAGADSWTW